MPPISFTFESTLEQIEQSDAFKNFKKQHPDTELCVGFFVLDFESQDEKNKKNQQQLDYQTKNGKIFTFIINPKTSEITIKQAETLESEKNKDKKLEKLQVDKIKIDLDDVQQIVNEELISKKINKKLTKIIAILHKPTETNKEIWNLNCMLSGLEILRIWISAETGEILKFEKRSMFDFIKKAE